MGRRFKRQYACARAEIVRPRGIDRSGHGAYTPYPRSVVPSVPTVTHQRGRPRNVLYPDDVDDVEKEIDAFFEQEGQNAVNDGS